jgi:hypothetical protein
MATGIEVSGLILASVSLAAQAFNGCIVGLQIISKAGHSHESMLQFNTKLDIEIARLLLWGRNSGLCRGELDESLKPVETLLLSILTSILSSIESTEKLKSTYGIDMTQDIGRDDDKDNKPRSRSPRVNRIEILSVPELSREIERQRNIATKLKKQASPFRKLKWAVWDGGKAKRFIGSISDYVDGLNKLLTESQKAALDGEFTAMRIAILGNDWPQPAKMLHALEAATQERYESIALPARLARIRLEYEMEELAPEPATLDTLPAQPLAIGFDQLHKIRDQYSTGRFNGSKILVEWRTFDSKISGERGRALVRQTSKLAGIFKELTTAPTTYKVLDCVGYINQTDHLPAEVGLVFKLPSLNLSKPPAPTEQFCTLHDYISLEMYENFLPSLGDRFELARQLARGFLQFHQLGWYHKDIRSHNIAFFPSDGSVSVQSPYILGFAYSRPKEKGISDKPKQMQTELYRHPEYRQDFKLAYDIFGIGLLLFEIAKWQPLSHYYESLRRRNIIASRENFSPKLLETEQQNLEFRMGIHYKSAVLSCLEGDDPNDKRMRLAYFEKVVKVLDQCRA